MKSAVKWAILAALGFGSIALVGWILWPQPDTPGQTRTQESGGVTVTATLLPGNGLRFRVVLDTHTVDLSRYDVVAMTRLVVGDVSVAPHGESGTTDNTGHHVEADLVFEGNRNGTIVLVLRDLGDAPERRLEFTP